MTVSAIPKDHNSVCPYLTVSDAKVVIEFLKATFGAETVLAIEALCATQGLDFRVPMRPGHGVSRARSAIRERVLHLEEDRSPSPDIAAVRELVHSGDLLAAADGS